MCRFAPDGTLLYVNRSYALFHDRKPQAMLGQCFLDFVHPSVRPGIISVLETMQHVTPDNPVRQSTHQTRSATGYSRWHEWTDRAFFDDQGQLLGFMSIGRDVTDIVAATKATAHDLIHDDLTGVLNRRGLFAILGDQLVNAAGPFLVGYVDIDQFKRINDQYGHREGDRVLVRVASALDALTEEGTTGRVGGDEFVVVVQDSDSEEEGPPLANQLNHTLGSLPCAVSASCGWAVAHPGDTADEVLHAADVDMYRRKVSRGKLGDNALTIRERLR